MSSRTDSAAPNDAARWFARMQDDQRTPAEEAEFDRWLADDPDHERQYHRLEAVWETVEAVRQTPQIRKLRSEALNQARAASATRHRLPWPFPGLRKGSEPKNYVKRWRVAASLVAIALIGMVAYRFAPIDRSYQTAVGERRAITLRDGTELTLNTNTRAHVRFSFRRRTVDLERGQAHFNVAHSTLRPFFVNAGAGVIRAVGTKFDVYRRSDEVRVALIEGKVTVTPSKSRPSGEKPRTAREKDVNKHGKQVLLLAGQAVSLTHGGLSAPEPARIDQATAWLDGKLIFNDERLRDAVFEINRYSTQKIIVLDEQLANLRVNGIFSTDRADTFIEAVRTSLPVAVEDASEGALLIVPDTARQDNATRGD